MLMKLDVALICGCRPDLLARTLESFEVKVFRNFDIATCHANVDPFGGSGSDRDACKLIIQQYFPSAIISTPEAPSFGQAVKTVWSQIDAPIAFHLEDDWIALRSIYPEEVEPLLRGSTRAVRLLSRHMSWNGASGFHERIGRYKWKGLTYRWVRTGAFGTSPGFWVGEFARRCAALLNADLDPEKQMRPAHNRQLFDYMHQFRCRVLHGEDQAEIIQDIGRKWREDRKIRKVVFRGASVWLQDT
jgi:hypothetical protein